MTSDYYLTVGSDNVVKVFHFDSTENPALIIEVKEDLADACWLPQNPNFVAVASAEGHVFLYNLSDTIEKPFETIPVPKIPLDQVLSVAVSESQHSLVVISKMGFVWQFSLSTEIFDEKFLLDRIYTT